MKSPKTLRLLSLALALSALSRAAETQTAPDFSSKELSSGKEIRLSELRGKVVLIDFWATWCPPCRMEIPHLIDLQKQYKAKGFTMIGISMDRSSIEPRRFIQAVKINYDLIWDNGAISQSYGGIRAIPTMFLIGKDGKVLQQFVGYHPKKELEKEIKAALKAP